MSWEYSNLSGRSYYLNLTPNAHNLFTRKCVTARGRINNQIRGVKELTLYTLTSVCIFSILFSIHFQQADKENLFNNQELLKLVIISSTLLTFYLIQGLYTEEKLDAKG